MTRPFDYGAAGELEDEQFFPWPKRLPTKEAVGSMAHEAEIVAGDPRCQGCGEAGKHEPVVDGDRRLLCPVCHRVGWRLFGDAPTQPKQLSLIRWARAGGEVG